MRELIDNLKRYSVRFVDGIIEQIRIQRFESAFCLLPEGIIQMWPYHCLYQSCIKTIFSIKTKATAIMFEHVSFSTKIIVITRLSRWCQDQISFTIIETNLTSTRNVCQLIERNFKKIVNFLRKVFISAKVWF